MSTRILPPRPNLDHLKHEARALHRAFACAEPAAVQRVHAVLPGANALKLTEAQRVVAREYGFTTWARLRAHVEAARGVEHAVDSFLASLERRDTGRATSILRAQPGIVAASMHVAAALGRVEDVRRLLRDDPSQLGARRGPPAAEPLLWLCSSPLHGQESRRDDYAACLRMLLDAGADPNSQPGRGGPPALYGLTGLNDEPHLARMLLEAGANPTDGESLHHAAERFHRECLELLLEYGADVNARGEWGNTPLYFLIRYWDLAAAPATRHGVLWLLDHGAEPDVRCGVEDETSLHAAARTGQDEDIVRTLLERGADVKARRADGRTAWMLAARYGHDRLAALLESFGAEQQHLDAAGDLLAACGRGDAHAARQLSSPELVASLAAEDLRMLNDAAGRGRHDIVDACLEAGFPVDMRDEHGATPLHHASIRGRNRIVRSLLRHGADPRSHDNVHDSPAMGWAFYGADFIGEATSDYGDTVRALLEAGARPEAGHDVASEQVRSILREHGIAGFA